MAADSKVNDRIKELLAHYGLNANSATQKLGYANTSKMYKILQGAEPSFPTLVDLVRAWPEVSLDWLVMGEGPMLRGATTDAAPAGVVAARPTVPDRSVTSGQVLAVTVDRLGNDNTLLVPVPAQAGYQRSFNEAVYLKQMRPYTLPGFEHGTYRAFEVSGESMAPTFGHHDIVVGSFVERWDLLQPNECYVVVTPENVLLKRIRAVITDRRGLVMLYSDNTQYDPYELPVADILELWMVKGFLSTNIPPTPDRTLERLQEVIELLGHDYGEVKRYLEENAPNYAPSARQKKAS